MTEKKSMKYFVDVTQYLELGDAITDGKTEKEAKALEGEWIKINETMFALVEDDRTTMIRTVGDTELGCGSPDFDPSTKLMSKYMIAFKDLKNSPQISIESSEYRWLQVYLLSQKWYVEDRYLYPPMPEATEELSSVDEKAKTISRTCAYCEHIEKGTDFDKVKRDIAEHVKTCQKNPANKEKSPKQEVPETTTPKKPTVAKSAPVESKPKNAEEKVKPSSKKFVCEMCGTEYESADDVLNCIERCKEAQDFEDTKALITHDTASDDGWSSSQIEVMRKTVAANATPEEFAYFLNVAKYTGLNPFLREIYFMKTSKGETAIITGRDGYLTIARRDPRFNGIHSMDVCEKDEFEMALVGGMMTVSKHTITNFIDRGEIIGAWACGRMDGQDPVTIFASMKEYDKSKNPLGGKIWKQYTSTMIRKVAEAMVLKRIAGISGLVTDAEIGGTDFFSLDGGD